MGIYSLLLQYTYYNSYLFSSSFGVNQAFPLPISLRHSLVL